MTTAQFDPRSWWDDSIGRLLASITVAVSIAVVVAPALAGEAGDIAAVEQRLHAVYKAAGPAIVKVEYLIKMHPAPGITYGGAPVTGIILSEEGHVVTRGHAEGYLTNEVRKGPVAITLPDGRRVSAVALGWSDAWNVEFFKITDKGPWPHVAIDASVKVRPGDRCAVLGYPEMDFEQERQSSLRTCLINQSAFPLWANTTLGSVEAFGAVFDLEGRLLGIFTRSMLSGFPTFTGTQILKERWDDLITFGNADRTQLESVKRIPGNAAAPEAPQSAREKRTAKDVAKSVMVHLEYPGKEKWRNSSGVIITAEGHVISHAHGGVRSSGDMLLMTFSDGRSVKGEVLGFNPIADLTLIKITERGPWPHAELGQSLTMTSGKKCTFAGFPQGSKSREPVIREMELVTQEDRPWHSCLTTLDTPAARLKGGDSGGGLFDSNGRLVGIADHLGSFPPIGAYFSRVELIQHEWDTLADQSLIRSDKRLLQVAKSSDPAEITNTFDGVAAACTSAVVEILVDGEPRLLGTIVGSDGVILTKASELAGEVSCRLGDGRVFPATIKKESREVDLAVLKIEAVDLPAVRWSESDSRVGSLCAAAGAGNLIAAGVVALGERPKPPSRGALGVLLEDSDRGIRVTDDQMAASRGVLLKSGDIVAKIAGQPAPDLKALESLLAPKNGAPIAIPGDFISVEVQRAKQKLNLRFRLYTQFATFSQFARSPRRTGFPSIFDISQALERTRCGGPVIDRSGAAIGIVIAARGQGGTSVLPAHFARKLLEQKDIDSK